jgi:hypothetical protein
MDCLGPNGKDGKYETSDVENMITPEQSSSASTQHGTTSSSKTGSKWSLPLVLSLITLAISLLALVLSIYASVVARKGPSSTASSTAAFLATSPRGLPAGYQAAHLFQGTGYFARLQPMLYPRSDHRVRLLLLGSVRVLHAQMLTQPGQIQQALGSVPAVVHATPCTQQHRYARPVYWQHVFVVMFAHELHTIRLVTGAWHAIVLAA